MEPFCWTDFKVKERALNYGMVGDELYKKCANGVLLKCLNKKESYLVMAQIHEGVLWIS